MNYKYDINNYRINRDKDHHVIGGKEYKAVDGAIAIFCTKDGDSDPLTLAEKSVTLFGQPVADTDTTRVWKNTAGDITLTVDKDKTFAVDEAVSPVGLDGYTCTVYKVFAAGDKFTELDTQGLGKKAFVEELAAEEVESPWEFGSLGEKSAQLVGTNAKAQAEGAVAEGKDTIASGEQSHAEGNQTKATGKASHAEGTYFTGDDGTVYRTTASGEGAHAEGIGTTASGKGSHAEGTLGIASGDYSHVQCNFIDDDARDNWAWLAEDYGVTITAPEAKGEGSVVEGAGYATGKYSHVRDYGVEIGDGNAFNTVRDYGVEIGDENVFNTVGGWSMIDGDINTDNTLIGSSWLEGNDNRDNIMLNSFQIIGDGNNANVMCGNSQIVGDNNGDNCLENGNINGTDNKKNVVLGGTVNGEANLNNGIFTGVVRGNDNVAVVVLQGDIKGNNNENAIVIGGTLEGDNHQGTAVYICDGTSFPSSTITRSIATTKGTVSGKYNYAETDGTVGDGTISASKPLYLYNHAETGGKVLATWSDNNHNHAETGAEVDGSYSHGEGKTYTFGSYNHNEGYENTIGDAFDPSASSVKEICHVEGRENTVSGRSRVLHVEGQGNNVSASNSHVEGTGNLLLDGSIESTDVHVVGNENLVNSCTAALIFGNANSPTAVENACIFGQQNSVTQVSLSTILGWGSDAQRGENIYIFGGTNGSVNADEQIIVGWNNNVSLTSDAIVRTGGTVLGKFNQLTGTSVNSTVFGNSNIITNARAEYVIGGKNEVTNSENGHGGGSYVLGQENRLTDCNQAVVLGYANVIDGTGLELNVDNTFVSGAANVANGSLNTVEGYHNTTNSATRMSHVEGTYNIVGDASDDAKTPEGRAKTHHAHVEGSANVAAGRFTHVEGFSCKSTYDHEHVEGVGKIVVPEVEDKPDNHNVIPLHIENNTWYVKQTGVDDWDTPSNMPFPVDSLCTAAVIGMRNADRYILGIGDFVGRYQTTIDGVERVIGETIKNADGTDYINPLTNKPEHYIKPVQEVIEIQNARIKHLEDLIEHLTEIIEP